MKNMNKVRNMKEAKYTRFIDGDHEMLERIKLMYGEYVVHNEYYPDGYFMDGTLMLRVTMDVWNDMVSKLGLILDKEKPQKRYWRIG